MISHALNSNDFISLQFSLLAPGRKAYRATRGNKGVVGRSNSAVGEDEVLLVSKVKDGVLSLSSRGDVSPQSFDSTGGDNDDSVNSCHSSISVDVINNTVVSVFLELILSKIDFQSSPSLSSDNNTGNSVDNSAVREDLVSNSVEFVEVSVLRNGNVGRGR